MSLDALWDEPVASPPINGDVSPLKRPRQSLFLADSDSDRERPPKRATPAPPPARPDVDALFEDLDKEEEADDLTYKPLVPALDLAKLAKEAEERHARARHTVPSQTLAGSSKTAGDSSGKDQGKDKPGDQEKKGRRVLPKLDDERLVGPQGFPLLIKDIEGFQPRGKGHEHGDLNRLLQIYQFWTHKMYPKTSFKDTINRVEKLCHSKRMQVRLSVWRDEFKGVTKDQKLADDSDVIDLTEPTLVATEDDGNDKEPEDPRLKSDQAPSRPPSLPPASSEADDDSFDIDVVIKAEEERLATLRAMTASADAASPRLPLSPTPPEKLASGISPDANTMDLDEASLWDAVDDSEMLFDPPQSNPPLGDTIEMWDIVDQMEQGGQSRPAAKTHIPISGVNLVPSLDSTNVSRATNDDDWDEMYS